MTAVDVKPLGNNYARELGAFSMTMFVIWQKVGDEWKLTDDIWNTNK